LEADFSDATGIVDGAVAGLVGSEGTMMSPAHRGRFVAYYRVSPRKQGRASLGLEAQKAAVLNYLNGRSRQLVGEFIEVESRKRRDTPRGLAKALAACKKRKAKLIVAKLDRLSRNVAFIANLLESKVEFIAADMPFADSMIIQLMSLFDEHERKMISLGMKAAVESAKAKGKVLSNPKIKVVSRIGRAKISTKAGHFAEALRPIIVDLQESGIDTLSGIAEELNIRDIRTYRNDGSKWYPSTVKNLLRRLASPR
jgi:DNA invertase Pin-like site-specific DNA recombinase